MQKIMKIITLSLVLISIFATHSIETACEKQMPVYTAVKETLVVSAREPVEFRPRESVISRGTPEMTLNREEEYPISQEDIELIALVTMAEAEGECEEGKRLVIDTILNRVDSNHFPDTVREVIYQPHQFSSMWNGRVDRCEVREDICKLVKEELRVRTNDKTIFFNAGHYSAYGAPMFKVEHHYFSSDD